MKAVPTLDYSQVVRQETLTLSFRWFESSLGNHAPVVELADTRDLKSLGVKPVPVRVWLGAPTMLEAV